jgi:hypothetical protein
MQLVPDDTRLEETDLSADLIVKLQRIGVRTLGQLRVLLAMKERTRVQTVTTLRRTLAIFRTNLFTLVRFTHRSRPRIDS